MVLEFLLGYEFNRPAHIFGTGLFFSSIAVFISAALFAHAPSMVVVTFMTLPLVYVYTSLLRDRSAHEAKDDSLGHLWEDNIKIAEDFMFLFLGMTVGVAIWFSILPSEMLANLFSEQLYNLNQIGVATGFGIRPDVFATIALNNVKLVLLSALMSFVFSAGALFILAWNASVVGVAVGILINKARLAGTPAALALGQGLGLGTAYYLLHLIPEVVSYFYAAVAGAFISTALLRYEPLSRKSNRLLAISGAMIAASIALILLAAIVEIQISHSIQSVLHI